MVTVTASQDGNDAYAAAPDVMRTITVRATVGTQSQTIDFTLANTGSVGEEIPLAATVTSGLNVFYTLTTVPPTGVATLVNNSDGTGTLTLTGAGMVTVTASQDGNDAYAAAPDVMRTITVSKQAQAITFSTPAGDITGTVGETISLEATTNATGLEVSFAISPTTGVATLTDAGAGAGTLTLTGEGAVTVTASQTGDVAYQAATDMTRTITVSPVLGIEEAVDGFVLYPNPTSGKLHFSERVGQFHLYGIEGRLLESWKNVRSVDLSARPAGLYFVEVIRDGRSLRWRVVRE